MKKTTFPQLLQFAFIVLCVTSCSMKLAGSYVPLQGNAFYSSALKLNNGSTFSYTIFSELQRDTFQGNWYVQKDTLILKITVPFNDDSLLKKEKVISKSNSSIPPGVNMLKVFEQDSIPFTVAKVFINDDQFPANLDSNGEAMVNNKINRIKITYQDITPRIFTINSSVNNDFTIYLYDKIFIPLNYLTPIRKWVIIRNSITPLDENNLPYNKKNAYKKL